MSQQPLNFKESDHDNRVDVFKKATPTGKRVDFVERNFFVTGTDVDRALVFQLLLNEVGVLKVRRIEPINCERKVFSMTMQF